MIKLFIKETCPYCKKVIDYLKTTNIKYDLLDILKEKSFMDELLRLGKINQVPFLFDTEKNITMYESKDIIEYLKTL